MSGALWSAFALVLVIEGLPLLIVPSRWREVIRQVSGLADGQLRFFGLVLVLTGLAILPCCQTTREAAMRRWLLAGGTRGLVLPVEALRTERLRRHRPVPLAWLRAGDTTYARVRGIVTGTGHDRPAYLQTGGPAVWPDAGLLRSPRK
jgi:uncharacterized protein YjeT (DUF2065 family)